MVALILILALVAVTPGLRYETVLPLLLVLASVPALSS